MAKEKASRARALNASSAASPDGTTGSNASSRLATCQTQTSLRRKLGDSGCRNQGQMFIAATKA